MDETQIVSGIAAVFALTTIVLWYALRESMAELQQIHGALGRWGEHLRGCPGRREEFADCSCGLAEFFEAIEGD